MMIGLANTISYAFQAWIPLVMFPTNKAPHYPIGYQVQAGFYGVAIIVTTVWLYLEKRDLRLGKYCVNDLGLPTSPGMEAVGAELEQSEESFDQPVEVFPVKADEISYVAERPDKSWLFLFSNVVYIVDNVLSMECNATDT